MGFNNRLVIHIRQASTSVVTDRSTLGLNDAFKGEFSVFFTVAEANFSMDVGGFVRLQRVKKKNIIICLKHNDDSLLLIASICVYLCLNNQLFVVF